MIEQTQELSLPNHPWRRYLARQLDIGIYSLAWLAIAHLLLNWNVPTTALWNLFSMYIAAGIMLVAEPLLLALLGTTPGKWIFGLTVRDSNGQKLSYSSALTRTLDVFGKGMGYCVPIYTWVRLYKSYKACQAQEPLVWEEGSAYTIKDRRAIRGIGYAGAALMLFALAVLVLLQAMMPVHRGELTPWQYADNCNRAMRYFRVDFGKVLTADGEWADEDTGGTVYYPGVVFPKHELTISNGAVTGIKIETSEMDPWPERSAQQKQIAVISFLAAQKQMNCIRLQTSNVLKAVTDNYGNYSFVESGVRVTQSVEYDGYEHFYGYDDMLFPKEGETQRFHMVFTLENVNDPTV